MDDFRLRLHRLLSQDQELRQMIEREAIGLSSKPQSNLDLAWREGRRSIAAEWMTLYLEVENERT